MEKKRRIFLTGATGVMGNAALKELMKYPDRYDITVLARDSKKNRKKLKIPISKGVKVVWGDLLNEETLKEGIWNADIVLHVGGMVSPMAEHYPEKTLKVNIGSMRLIAGIVKEIETREHDRVIKTVYVGSVSQYGSNLPPNHWGKAGDRLKSAKFDAYAVSKILAERELLEAGLKRWVSIRQTAILHKGLLMKANDPVSFHVPLNGVLEWISVEDSGRLLERICREEVPDNFWNNFYNAGGGEELRLTNLEFERGLMKAMGCPPPEKVFEPGWFAKDNFHGLWFEDSDLLEEILHFRSNDTFEKILSKMKGDLPFYFKMAPLVPSKAIKIFMKRVAKKKELGPLWWLESGDKERISAAWGSRDLHDETTSWEDFRAFVPERRKPEPIGRLKSEDTRLSRELCSRGHRYFSSEALRAGGHGCPECLFIDSKVERGKF